MRPIDCSNLRNSCLGACSTRLQRLSAICWYVWSVCKSSSAAVAAEGGLREACFGTSSRVKMRFCKSEQGFCPRCTLHAEGVLEPLLVSQDACETATQAQRPYRLRAAHARVQVKGCPCSRKHGGANESLARSRLGLCPALLSALAIKATEEPNSSQGVMPDD